MKTEIENAVQGYRTGRLSASKFIAILFQHLDESKMPIFLQMCPPELMAMLEAVVEVSPTTDAEWAKVKFVETTIGDKLTPEETDKALALLRSRYRTGVETLRKHLREK